MLCTQIKPLALPMACLHPCQFWPLDLTRLIMGNFLVFPRISTCNEYWHCHICIKCWHSGSFEFAGYHATRVHILQWTKSRQILMHREMGPFVKCCLLSCRVVWITYNFWHVAKHEFVVKCKLTTSSLSGATRFFCDESSMVALGTLDSSVPVGLISDVFSGGKSIWEC